MGGFNLLCLPAVGPYSSTLLLLLCSGLLCPQQAPWVPKEASEKLEQGGMAGGPGSLRGIHWCCEWGCRAASGPTAQNRFKLNGPQRLRAQSPGPGALSPSGMKPAHQGQRGALKGRAPLNPQPLISAASSAPLWFGLALNACTAHGAGRKAHERPTHLPAPWPTPESCNAPAGSSRVKGFESSSCVCHRSATHP